MKKRFWAMEDGKWLNCQVQLRAIEVLYYLKLSSLRNKIKCTSDCNNNRKFEDILVKIKCVLNLYKELHVIVDMEFQPQRPN